MTPSGIEPANFRFVAQYLNRCAIISGPQLITVFDDNNINSKNNQGDGEGNNQSKYELDNTTMIVNLRD
jgi:hypothetical protein